jgi:hypothetical protein
MNLFSFSARSISVKVFLAAAAVLGLGTVARATESASADMSALALGGGEFDYTITLTDTGTTNLETFWFSWVPGKDFMAVSPTNIVSPTNWTANITGGGPSDGYAIQWVTPAVSTASPLTPGVTDTFSFESTVNPVAMAGDSVFYSSTPIGTSFVYTGAPFSDAGFEFVVDSVPEPSTLAMMLAGVLVLGIVLHRRTRASR